MPNTNIINVTRMDAARRQLQAALTLWFADGDAVSIHSLVGSAYQVLHDLNRKAKGPPLLFDSPLIKKEMSKEAVASLKAHLNFFKHADLRKGDGALDIDFDPALSELYFLACLLGVEALGESLNAHESAFMLWRQLHGPMGAVENSKKMLSQQFSAEGIAALRGLEKGEFIAHYLASRATRRAAGLQ